MDHEQRAPRRTHELVTQLGSPGYRTQQQCAAAHVTAAQKLRGKNQPVSEDRQKSIEVFPSCDAPKKDKPARSDKPDKGDRPERAQKAKADKKKSEAKKDEKAAK